MFRKRLAIFGFLIIGIALAAAPNTASSQSKLSAAEIVDKNVAARGGLPAWRAVQTMSMTGKMGAGGNQRAAVSTAVPGQKSALRVVPQRPAEEAQLPFLMELARVRKMRLELQFNGQTAIQVYDGANGWKVRPFLNRLEVEPYTAEETKVASMQADLDGPLVDYAAKGTQIELASMERVEGRDSYNLKLTMKSGQTTHIWIDAQTFLEAKMEGQPRRLDGVDHPVEIYYRDYRQVDGLQIPFVMETKVLPVKGPATGIKDTPVPVEKIIIEKVVVNPKLDATLFSKPKIEPAPKAK